LLSEGSSQAAGGSHYDAVTAWSLHWSFRYDRGPSQCALAAANIDLQIEVRLPELARDEALDPALLERWRAYAVALETHEMGHVDRETAVVEALRDEFENAAPGPDCGEVGQRLNQIGADYQRQVSITDAVYDQETGHGATQGAVFP
jgi:predicted secreted Zn-dependent protease